MSSSPLFLLVLGFLGLPANPKVMTVDQIMTHTKERELFLSGFSLPHTEPTPSLGEYRFLPGCFLHDRVLRPGLVLGAD